MKLKDCRILWNITEKGNLITDIEIHEFNKENGSFPGNLYLHKKFARDEGNACADWKEWDISHVLSKFLFYQRFESEDVLNKFRKELCKIDEFKNINDFLK